MNKNIVFKNINISYNIIGESENTVVFLHGYLEAKEIWQEFSEKLKSNYKVILIDLLGHGKSGVVSDEHSMKLMADSVKAVIDYEKVGKCILVGHSMGGYVTLEFANNYEQILKGFCLFHSQPFPDTDEKKVNRIREIELVKQGKFNLIVETNTPNMYADGKKTKFPEKLELSKEIAKDIKPEGVIAALNGMKSRKENLDIIKNFKKPMLFISGKKDNLIPFNENDKLFSLNPKMQLVILENSGHMGMFEESEKSYKKIEKFIKTCL
jgi:pimeloyl-ACP methyl ester carboxylesterase